jgi:hypothetical protein
MPIVLDAGGLIAVDKGNRRVVAMLRIAHQERIPVRTSSAVVAQVWRDGTRQANLARTLLGIDVVAIDQPVGRRIGELLALNGTADVIDGHVALMSKPADTVVTSDVADIESLLETRRVRAVVLGV